MKNYVIAEQDRNALIQLLSEMPYKTVSGAIVLLAELKEQTPQMPPKVNAIK